MSAISRYEQIPLIVETIMKIQPRKILDIGAGFGMLGFLTKAYIDLWQRKWFKKNHITTIHALDAYTDYYTFQYDLYDKIIKINVLDFNDFDNYDTIYCFDLLQHLKKDKAKTILNKLEKHTGNVLLSIPLGNGWIRNHPDPYESHLSEWEIKELVDYGFNLLKEYSIPDGRKIGLFLK